ncbi:MAG TPA: lamin tail domain-containing protein [Gaiellaceae bacterium]|nr:lamin tail domain-containing protein [Gaiellaceae bacterium]
MTRTRLLLAAALAASLLVLPTVARASASGVVVSQVYGGGGNAGATFTNDFVELFNAGSSAVDLSGWTIQYATSTGTSWSATALSGTIAPRGYYLVQLASSADVGAALPAPDATGTTNLSASSGKIALVRDVTPLTCGDAAGSCSADSSVEDLVGYGSASDFEGSGSAPAGSSTEAVLRNGGGCTDAGDNAADFASDTPAPRNSASPAAACSVEPPPSGGESGSVDVDVDVAPVLSISVDRPSLSFGNVASGTTPDALAENVTVGSNNLAGYGLSVGRTAFSPADLPLALGATAPAGGVLGDALSGGGLAAVPVGSGGLAVGTTSTPSQSAGDVWATRIGFASALPLVAAGHYTATVTFTVIAR